MGRGPNVGGGARVGGEDGAAARVGIGVVFASGKAVTEGGGRAESRGN